MGYEGTLYETANEIFDEVVFTDERDLELYNGEPSPYLARDELYEIIGEMIYDAEKAMRECAESNRERFLRLVKEVGE